MTERELRELLAEPESESIEFKPGLLSRSEIAEYAVGIGNSGGGWLLMGVSDKSPRHIIPTAIPRQDEIAGIRESVADATQIRVEIDVVTTAEGTVIAIRIPSRLRGIPFHTQGGKYLIRLGERLRGMTLSEIDAIRREAGDELTSYPVAGDATILTSASALEDLRRLMVEAGAAEELTRLSDPDLLHSLGVLGSDGRLSVAGLLLAGRPDAIRDQLPHARWQFRRMKSDTDYDQADDGMDSIPVALRRLRELVGANNPIVTIKGPLVHAEFPRYPLLALRELIVNALAHRDYEVPGAVTLKLYPDRLELSNPGGFVGGVTVDNILHHPSSPRYPALFQALARMRLANAVNLGVPRVFRDLLREGKEPPSYWTSGHAVRVTVKGQEARPEFLKLVDQYPALDVDDLTVIHYLTRHREVTVARAAEICRRSMDDAREILARLANVWRLAEIGGSPGRGRYYRLSRVAYSMLVSLADYHLDRRLTTENAKARVLSALADGPLTNSEIREITQMGRLQAFRLMKRLEAERLTRLEKKGRASKWTSVPKSEGHSE